MDDALESLSKSSTFEITFYKSITGICLNLRRNNSAIGSLSKVNYTFTHIYNCQLKFIFHVHVKLIDCK